MHSSQSDNPGLSLHLNSKNIQNDILMNTIETLENLKIHYEVNNNPSLQRIQYATDQFELWLEDVKVKLKNGFKLKQKEIALEDFTFPNEYKNQNQNGCNYFSKFVFQLEDYLISDHPGTRSKRRKNETFENENEIVKTKLKLNSGQELTVSKLAEDIEMAGIEQEIIHHNTDPSCLFHNVVHEEDTVFNKVPSKSKFQNLALEKDIIEEMPSKEEDNMRLSHSLTGEVKIKLDNLFSEIKKTSMSISEKNEDREAYVVLSEVKSFGNDHQERRNSQEEIKINPMSEYKSIIKVDSDDISELKTVNKKYLEDLIGNLNVETEKSKFLTYSNNLTNKVYSNPVDELTKIDYNFNLQLQKSFYDIKSKDSNKAPNITFMQGTNSENKGNNLGNQQKLINNPVNESENFSSQSSLVTKFTAQLMNLEIGSKKSIKKSIKEEVSNSHNLELNKHGNNNNFDSNFAFSFKKNIPSKAKADQSQSSQINNLLISNPNQKTNNIIKEKEMCMKMLYDQADSSNLESPEVEKWNPGGSSSIKKIFIKPTNKNNIVNPVSSIFDTKIQHQPEKKIYSTKYSHDNLYDDRIKVENLKNKNLEKIQLPNFYKKKNNEKEEINNLTSNNINSNLNQIPQQPTHKIYVEDEWEITDNSDSTSDDTDSIFDLNIGLKTPYFKKKKTGPAWANDKAYLNKRVIEQKTLNYKEIFGKCKIDNLDLNLIFSEEKYNCNRGDSADWKLDNTLSSLDKNSESIRKHTKRELDFYNL
jgi:hypothetical protein